MPVFALPLALLGLAALPTLAAIYWLRNRFRRQPVSSLMLWADQRRPREGGVRMQRLQTPLLFFLELVALALLALAAAGPTMLLSGAGTPLMIVLDDSFSMQAEDKEGESARDRGLAVVRSALDERGLRGRLILAGEQPEVLGEPLDHASDAEPLLSRWRGVSPEADLRGAVTFAAELGGPTARVLVVTDQRPAEDLAEGRTRWHAVGEPAGNFAIVNATRTASGSEDRVLIEVANLSEQPGATTLTLRRSGGDAVLDERTLEIPAGDTRRVVLSVPGDLPAIAAVLEADALAVDNRVALAPPNRRAVRVGIDIENEDHQQMLLRALRSTGRVRLVSERPELLFTDRTANVNGAGSITLPGAGVTWPVQLVTVDDPQPYVGPFVVNHNHPLGEGLSLGGVVWAAGEAGMEGEPVVTAGNIDLVTDLPRLDGRHELRMQFHPDASNVQQSINWPILIWNLVQWRAGEAPGLAETNIRLGRSATLMVAPGVVEVQVTDPAGDGTVREVLDRQLVVQPDQTGLWTFEPIAPEPAPGAEQGEAAASAAVGDSVERFALGVNALRRDESRLTDLAAGEWGDWLADATVRRQYTSIAWVLLLIALGALTLHGFLISRSSTVSVAGAVGRGEGGVG